MSKNDCWGKCRNRPFPVSVIRMDNASRVRVNTDISDAVRYTTTADEVRVAYHVFGSGPLLLVCGNPMRGQIDEDWSLPECRRFYEYLSKHHTIVRFDYRGVGFSGPVSTLDIEGCCKDIEAILNEIDCDETTLVASMASGAIALTFAAKHPERVGELILFHAFASMKEWQRSPRVQALEYLAHQDWELYSHVAARLTVGWNSTVASRYASFVQASAAPKDFVARLQQLKAFDAATALDGVLAPTLVMHRKNFDLLPLSHSRKLASMIDRASLTLLSGSCGAVWTDDWLSTAKTISRFINRNADLTPTDASSLDGLLTKREVSVLRLLAEGLTNKEIGNEFGLSVHTVERHIANIYLKTSVRGRAAIAIYAHEAGLL